MEQSIDQTPDGQTLSPTAAPGRGSARTGVWTWQLSWQTTMILSLLGMSAFFFAINYVIFVDPAFTLKLVTLQLAFLPISVILITFFINRLIGARERSDRLAKLSMVIGVFFSEVGTSLLHLLLDFDADRGELVNEVRLTVGWTDEDYSRARRYLKSRDCNVEIDIGRLSELREFLVGKREFLMRLLENPSLLEHESFTDLLRAVFHLTDELVHRTDVAVLPPSDYAHLGIDIKRAYSLLLTEWLAYMQDLRDSYPYFYSLAIRVNPLDPDASPEVV